MTPVQRRRRRVDETNNLRAVATDVTPVPADLVVTNVSIPTGELLGRADDVHLHGRERGPEPGLGGHGLLDRLHLALRRPDVQPHSTPRSWARRPTPRTSRCSPAQSYTDHLHGHAARRAPAASTTSTSTSTPTTTCRPNLYTYQARLETTDWWPADTGDNSYWLEPVQPLGVRGPEQQPHRHAVQHHLPRAGPQGDEHHRAART